MPLRTKCSLRRTQIRKKTVEECCNYIIGANEDSFDDPEPEETIVETKKDNQLTKKHNMTFTILSPDGIPLHIWPIEAKDIEKSFDLFKKRYERQGYYSTVKNGKNIRIPLDEFCQHCTIIVNKEEQKGIVK